MNSQEFKITGNINKINFIFFSREIEVGRLTENDGILSFEGNVNESAKLFVNEICKQFNSRIQDIVNDKINKL